MKRLLLSIPLILAIAPANATSWQDVTNREHAFAVLLLSKADIDVHLGAQGVFRSNSNSPELLDLTAEVTWMACSGKQEVDYDTLSWLAKALGNSKQQRYAALLDYCIADPANSKSKKYLTRAREQLTREATGSFEGGKLDLQQIRDQLKGKGSDLSGQPAPKFDTSSKRRSLDAAYAALGRPDEIGTEKIKTGKVGHRFVKISTSEHVFVLKYNILGTAYFVYDEERGDWMLYEPKEDPMLFWLRKEERFVNLGQAIAYGDGLQLRGISEILIKKRTLDRDLLDQLATRIHKSRLEEDDDVADGLAWLCRVIGASGDGRYKPFLLDISKTAEEKVLRKYAAKATEKMRETNEALYVPPVQ